MAIRSLALVALLSLMVVARPLAAQNPTAQPRWQYAELNLGAGVVSWTTGDSMRVFVNGVKEAAQAFGVPENRSTGVLTGAILDTLGDKSWELMFVTESPRGTTYHFKRRKV